MTEFIKPAMVPYASVHGSKSYNQTLETGTSHIALEYWRKQPTTAIAQSLRPGNREALKVKPDGRIMDGNTRIKVLEERGVDVNSLPREVLP